MKKYRFGLLFLLTIFLYLFLRLWNLDSLITFHIDQGLQLSEAYTFVQERKITLLGPMVISKTYQGRGFFIGPFYTYTLMFLGIITAWNPLLVTSLLVLFELSALLLFLKWLTTKHSLKAILLLFFLTATTPFLIEHSRFFWNPHFLLPLSFLLIYFLENKKYFLAAIVWGLAFSFHYSAAMWALPFLYYLIKNKESFSKYLLCIPSFILGDLPWFFFEFKHNFYNLKTMFLVFTNTNKAGELSAYYFVFPFFAFFIFLMLRLYQKAPKIFYQIFILTLLFNLYYQFNLQEKIPVGMPSGWDYPLQKKVVKMITQDACPIDYNVATTISGDTRANDLRFLLTIANCPPSGVDTYPKNQSLFLIAPTNRPPESESVWEVSSFRPFTVSQTVKLNESISFYRLDKIVTNP